MKKNYMLILEWSALFASLLNNREKENLHRFRMAPKHFHDHVSADNWTKELSQYDAG